MTVLLTGGSGRLGSELQKLGDYMAPSHAAMDITNLESVRSYVWYNSPDLIVHAAAYTDTFGAERDSNEVNKCWRLNVVGTKNIVAAATCPVVLISTEAAIHPYSFYILTKMQAELEVARCEYGYVILRTSFRDDPFPYPQAFLDMWTLGDSTPVIAEAIHNYLHHYTSRVSNRVQYIGTGPKTMYDLALRTRPDVAPCLRADVMPHLPSLEELKLV